VPVQVKDCTDKVGEEVAEQLERAFKSRSRKGQYVIAVVLLVTNATASPELKERMRLMSEKYNIPFLYCIAGQMNPGTSSGKDCCHIQS